MEKHGWTEEDLKDPNKMEEITKKMQEEMGLPDSGGMDQVDDDVPVPGTNFEDVSADMD